MDNFRPRHILAATDGSPRSLGAVTAAAQLAARIGATLTIVTTSTPLPGRSADARGQLEADMALTATADEARERLRDAKAAARAHGIVPAIEHIHAQEPFEGILDTARVRGCDLIVAAPRGRGRAAGLILGSQTLGLVARSPVPLLICPRGRVPSWSHVLVPIDGTEAAESAIPAGAELARLEGGHLTLLMCSPLLSGEGQVSGGRYEDLVRKAADERLASAGAIARACGVAATLEHTFAAAPWRAIVDAAQEIGAGAICMASHQRSGRLAAAFASEALKVLTHARVPVLLCRAHRPAGERGAGYAVEAA